MTTSTDVTSPADVTSPTPHDPFVSYLHRRYQSNGVRAAAARDVGRPPEASHRTHAVVSPFLPDGDRFRDRQRTHLLYAIATWYARWGHLTPNGRSVGSALRVAVDRDVLQSASAERRLGLLARANDLIAGPQLRQLLSYLDLDWSVLMRDLDEYCRSPNRVIQRWYRDFFQTAHPDQETS